jgi:hypothetical protein
MLTPDLQLVLFVALNSKQQIVVPPRANLDEGRRRK